MSVNMRTRAAKLALRIILSAAAAIFGLTHSGKADAATPSADPAAGRVLGGLSSQQLPVIANVSSNGKQITPNAALNMTCGSGNQFVVPDGWTKLPVAPNGSVHISIPLPPLASAMITGGSDSLTGRLNRKNATFSGVWDLHLNYTQQNGQPDSCDSGRVSFRIRL